MSFIYMIMYSTACFVCRYQISSPPRGDDGIRVELSVIESSRNENGDTNNDTMSMILE